MNRTHARSAFALLIALWLAACTTQKPTTRPFETPLPASSPAAAATLSAPTAGAARLLVLPNPDGAQVAVDGTLQGSAPLTLTLPAGAHVVALSAAGYAPYSETITLEAGREAMYAPDLEDIEPPTVRLDANVARVSWQGQAHVHAAAADNAGVVDLELALDDQTLAAVEGSELAFDLTPAAVPGMQAGQTYTLTATATDAAGNVGQAWLPLVIDPNAPKATPMPGSSPPAVTPTQPARPTPVPTRPPAVSFRETEITIPTYGFAPFVAPTTDPALGDYAVLTLDRTAYEASDPQPAPVTYTLLVLENRYLRVSLLPELGGRIYEVTFKPTGNDELYRNPVIKPTHWGPPSPPYPAGANWWLAAGGIEWEFPVEEHGYEWAKAWGYDSARRPDGSVTVSVFSTDSERPHATVDVTLAPETACFTVQPTIGNPTEAQARVKWWSNAMLAPGPANQPGPDLRFIFPVAEVTVHSTADPSLPAAGQPMSWPIYNGRDMSRLGNWAQYLGFFERPAAGSGYMGVYDTSADEGMVRIYPPDVARGAKGFGVGWSQPIDPSTWTDGGSGYVELHGGLAPTFDDWYELAPGSQVTWQEAWYPVAKIGGVTYATTAAAVSLAPAEGGQRVSLFPTAAVQGEVRITWPGTAPVVRPADISPAQPFSAVIPAPQDAQGSAIVGVTLVDGSGKVVFCSAGPSPSPGVPSARGPWRPRSSSPTSSPATTWCTSSTASAGSRA